MRCPACQAENPVQAIRCHKCGKPFAGGQTPVEPLEEVEEALLDEPEKVRGQSRVPRKWPKEEEEVEEAGLGRTVIPYKNPCALGAYYCTFLGLISGLGAITLVVFICYQNDWIIEKVIDRCRSILYYGLGLGIFLELLAITLGLAGYFKQMAHPEKKGLAHALTGIILGGLFLAAEVVTLILLIRYINELMGRH